jgi:hypothetical protein
MPISALLIAIPAVVWAAIMASLITLSGVMLSNWSNTKRLRLQLQHDADEKAKERKAALRREVYLPAAAEIVKVNAYLGSLASVGSSGEEAGEKLQGFSSAIAKVQLVAEPATSLLAAKLQTEYGVLVLKLMEKVYPMQELDSRITLRNNLWQNKCDEVSRVLAETTRLRESGKPDATVLSKLGQSFDFFQGKANEISAEREELWRKRNELHAAFLKYLLPELKRLTEPNLRLLVEIRKELEIAGHFEDFVEQARESQAKLEAQLGMMLNNLDTPAVEA